ncbi:MAG: LysR family transcriptional regulator [Gammaproteobacteria bacterium]|nr:LysR family transcriptional regulator [Gammaproteobacteria bacterium]
MDTVNLYTFIIAAERESFSLAAEQLYLTQPAVSKRIATLEGELGAALFDRIGRRVSLTEAGRELLPRARAILRDIEDSRRLISNLTGHVAGRLSIGTSHHIGLHRIPPVLRQFTRAYPQVDLDLQFMDSEAACRAVHAGELELGIVTLPLEPLTDLHSELLWRDPLAIVVGRDHPLASRASTPQRPIEVAELARHHAILPSEATYTRELLERSFAPHGLRLHAPMTTNYLETIKMMVSIGLGWSVLPETLLSADLVSLPVPALQMTRQLGVVHHRARTLSNAARAMIEALRATADR